MGKKPLNEQQVRTLRKLTSSNALHSLLLNLSVDLMLRSSDLLQLKVSDVLASDGRPKDVVRIRTKKTNVTTVELPLSKHSKLAISTHLAGKSQEAFIFTGQKSHYTGKPISTQQYQRIIKGWMRELGIADVTGFSSHSMRKTKASIIYDKTKNVEAVRRLLAHQSVTATSSYLGVEDQDATDLARQFDI